MTDQPVMSPCKGLSALANWERCLQHDNTAYSVILYGPDLVRVSLPLLAQRDACAQGHPTLGRVGFLTALPLSRSQQRPLSWAILTRARLALGGAKPLRIPFSQRT